MKYLLDICDMRLHKYDIYNIFIWYRQCTYISIISTVNEVLLWTPSYGRVKAGWPACIYIQQLCEDTGWSLENLPEVMNDREGWRGRVQGYGDEYPHNIYNIYEGSSRGIVS